MKKTLTIIILFGLSLLTSAQSVLLKENFENGQIPSSWSQKLVKGNFLGNIVPWQIRDENTPLPNPNPYADSAASGKYYAYFYYSGTNGEATRLITPKINMLGRVKPTLEFQLIIKRWNQGGFKNNTLKILYKSGNDTIFHSTPLREFSAGISSWQKQSILLPDSILNDNFYLAFEGTNLGGPIIGIDSIKIYETDVAPRQVLKLTLNQPFKDYLISGSTSNPMARLDVYVGGNQNTLTLNSLKLTSQNTNDNDINTSGVKLYYTTDSLWNEPVQIPVTANFSSGKATLSGINYSLSSGINTFWITYNIKATAQPSDILDLRIAPNDISIGSQTFPSISLNPSGSRMIREKVYFDDFEDLNNWTKTGDFQKDIPLGKGGLLGQGSYGLSDPTFAYSGSYILGNDLTGLEAGIENGNIKSNIPSATSCYAESPLINCRYFKNTKLRFHRKLGIHFSDMAEIYISKDGGTNWTSIWNNNAEGGSIADNTWKQKDYDLSSFADRAENVKIRFTVGPTGENNIGCGWNIDDVTVSADSVKNDLGVTEWISPQTGCGLSNSESVKIKIHNFANKVSKNIIPVMYSFDGITFFKDTIKKALAAGQDTIFTFSNKINLSTPAYYPNIIAKVKMESDDDTRNDSIITRIYSLPLMQAPFVDDFETKNIWVTESSSSVWQYGTPSKDNLNNAHSGTKAYITYTHIYYNNNESGTIESPCINTTTLTNPAISFYYNASLEQKKDGVALQYSIDNGSTWSLVPNHAYSWKGNWYNNTVSALGSKGWDTTSYGWVWARQILPISLAGKSDAKFRFVFKSNESEIFEGFAFDDFKILEAPMDAQIVSVNNIKNNCLGVKKDTIGFTLKNVGISPITTTDTLTMGYSINDTLTVWQKFNLGSSLAVNSTISLNFQQTVSYKKPGNYNIKVFIKESEPDFYETKNDTASKTKIVFTLPASGLADTISTARVDSLYIRPLINSNYDYKWPNNSTANTWKPLVYGSNWVNIKLKDTTACSIQDTFYVRQLIRNYKVGSIINPHNDCKVASSGQISFSIKNVGTDTLLPKDIASTSAFYKFNGGAAVSKLVTFTNKIKPGDSVIVQFTPTISPITNGSSVKAYFTKIPLDVNNSNDTLNYSVVEYGFPYIYLGIDTSINGFSLTLNAGSGFKKYLWNDNSSNQTYNATFTGIHWAEVTDNYNCSSRDSINVIIRSYDISANSILNPKSDCQLPGLRSVSISAKNTGTSKILAGTNIHLGYKLNNGVYHYEDSILVNDLIPNDSIIKTFNSIKENFSVIGDYKISILASYSEDMEPKNDSLTKTIYNYGYPSLNLGQDITKTALNHIIDAQAGAGRTFLWQDGKTEATYNATQSGDYSVIVTNTITNCKSYDTVKITLITPDAGVWEIISPATNKECSKTFKEVSFYFNNIGNTIIPSGQNIYAGCKINGVLQNQIFTIQQELAPGSKFKCTFSNISSSVLVNLENDFVVFARFAEDINSANDTAEFKATIYKTPELEIGDINKTFISYNPIVFDAGLGFNYLWSNGKTKQLDTISSTGKDTLLVWAKITAMASGCTNSDSVRVFIMKPNVEIKDLQISHCQNELKSANLNIENKGNTTIKTNDSIYIEFTLNKDFYNTSILDTIIPKTNIAPDAIYAYSMKKIFNKINYDTLKGPLYMFIRSYVKKDIDMSTLYTKDVNVDVSPSYIIDNGNDTIYTVMDYIVNINNLINHSNYTYLWQDGSSSDFITANEPGSYKVNVKDKNTLCSTTDSIYVKMDITDLALNSIVHPEAICIGDINELGISIKNTGNQLIASGESFLVKYNLNDQLINTVTISLLSNLYPGNSYIYSVKNLGAYILNGENTFTAIVKYTKDVRIKNDTLVYQFTAYPKPVLTLSDQGDTIKLDNIVTITAGNNLAYTYNWNSGQTGRIIEPMYSGNFVVTATDPVSECTRKDSIYVIVSGYDAEVAIKGINSDCSSEFDAVTLSYKNTGKYDLPVNTSINFGYCFNNNQFTRESFNLSVALKKGEELSKVISGLSKKYSNGATFTVFASNNLDTFRKNDTAKITLNIKQSPNLYIYEDDTIYLNTPYLISGHSNFAVNYLWSTGATTQQINATQQGKYILKVTDPTTNCSKRDSVTVIYSTMDGRATGIGAKQPACVASENNIEISYKNLSSTTLQKNDSIIVYLELNNSKNFEKYRYVLTEALAFNQSVLIIFPLAKNKAKVGSNSFKAVAHSKKDINPVNDTIKGSSNFVASPSINIENGRNTIEYSGSYVIDAGPGYASYLWSNNAASQQITITNSALYIITVTNEAGCPASDSVQMINTTGIMDNSGIPAMTLYPNPSSDKLTIRIDNIQMKDAKMDIVSIDSKLVYSERLTSIHESISKSINVSNWKKGMYYIRLYENNGSKSVNSNFTVQ